MKLASKIILHVPLTDEHAIYPFIAQCVAESVLLICVAGAGSEAVHDQIDGIIEDLGSDIATTWHDDNEPLDGVRAFAVIFGNATDDVADIWL